MSTTLIIGLGLVAAGGAYLVLRKRAAASASTDVCAGITDAWSRAECEAGKVIAHGLRATTDAIAGAGSNLVGGIVGDTSDFNPGNVQRNGPVVEWLDDAMVKTTGGACIRQTKDGKLVVRHANGCEPYKGAAGWSKCATGTRAMERGNCVATQGGYRKHPSALMDGDPKRDPATFRWEDRLLKGTTRDLPFPLAVPKGGTAWVVRGRAVACAVGSEVRGGDRTGGSPCVASYGTGAGQAPTPDAPPVVIGNSSSGPRRR